MDEEPTNHLGHEETGSPAGGEDHALAVSSHAPAPGLPVDDPTGGPSDEPGDQGGLSSPDMPALHEASGSLGPVSVEAHQIDSGGVLPGALSVVLTQLHVDLQTQPLAADLDLTAGRLDSGRIDTTGLTADATISILGRYDVTAHAEGGDLDAMLDFMRQGRPIILGVERSEFWATVDDRGADGAGEPVRLGEWRSESDIVQLFSGRQPDVPLYEITKSAFLARWREQEARLVVIDDAPQSGDGPLPVLLPVILDAVSGVKEISRHRP